MLRRMNFNSQLRYYEIEDFLIRTFGEAMACDPVRQDVIWITNEWQMDMFGIQFRSAEVMTLFKITFPNVSYDDQQ